MASVLQVFVINHGNVERFHLSKSSDLCLGRVDA